MIKADSSSSDSAYLSTPFDMGGICGAIVAGYMVDRTGDKTIIQFLEFHLISCLHLNTTRKEWDKTNYIVI